MKRFRPITSNRQAMHAVLPIPMGITMLAGICSSHSAYAQNAAPDPQTTKGLDAKASPQGGPGLQVDIGYRRLFGDRKDNVYYNIQYLGQTLSQQGKAFNDAQGYNGFASFRNDSPQLSLSIQRGYQTVDGPLAKYLQLAKLPRLKGFRAIVQGYGTFQDTSSLGFSAGVETEPLSLHVTAIPNFTTLGLQFGTQPVTNGTGSTATKTQSDVGLLAYRQYLAYAPLDTYSDMRKKVRAFALAVDSNLLLVNYYSRIESGDTSFLKEIAISPKAKDALTSIGDSGQKTLVQDLQTPVIHEIAALPVTPEQEASISKTILDKLTAAEAGTPLAAFRDHIASIASRPPRPFDWKAFPLRAVRGFLGNGGLERENPKDEASAKKYVDATFNLPDPSTSPGEDAIYQAIEVAYKEPAADKRLPLLIPVNRAILDYFLPELKALGVTLQSALLDMYYYRDRSSFVLSVENTGQYYMFGNSGNGSKSRLNSLFASTMTWYADPGAQQRNFLRLRYENGRDRADPKPYVNQVTISAGIEF